MIIVIVVTIFNIDFSLGIDIKMVHAVIMTEAVM